MGTIVTSIIVDDEANSRENTSMLLEQFCPNVRVVGMADDITTAEKLIESHNPQLVFLDIQLGTEVVFSLLTKLKEVNFEIIFITAHNHYALKAFEFMAVDYLLKPVDISHLVKAVTNASMRIENKTLHLSIEQMMMHVKGFNRTQHKVALSTGKGYEMVYIKDIMYCLAGGSYTHFHFKDGTEKVVSKNLKYYENLLDGYEFVRTHNTTLVNLQYVKTIERINGGAIVMEGDKILSVSKVKRQQLEGKIKENRRLL
jgi:two-component system LytT family response regulator